MKRRFAMLLGLVISACAIAGFLLAVAIPAAAATPNPFRGTWRGYDPDGSRITIKFLEQARSSGTVFEIRASDNATGPWCSGRGAARMTGIGVLESEHSLEASMVWWCLAPGEGVYPPLGSDPAFYQDTFTYNPTTDTISDTYVEYHRID